MESGQRYCGGCGRPAALQQQFCTACGRPLGHLLQIQSTPAPVSPGYPHFQPPEEADAPFSGIFPYKNGKALLAYYLGVFSLVLALLAIPAIILGVLGYKDYQAEPRIKGAGHAWTGIILGSLVILGWTLLICFMLIPV